MVIGLLHAMADTKAPGTPVLRRTVTTLCPNAIGGCKNTLSSSTIEFRHQAAARGLHVVLRQLLVGDPELPVLQQGEAGEVAGVLQNRVGDLAQGGSSRRCRSTRRPAPCLHR